VAVTGPDAERLLQDTVTQDLGLLATQGAIYAALLSAQGKILFDFFIAKADDGYLLETAADKTVELIKRLTLYRLRAKVQFADRSDDTRVLVLWGSSPASLGPTKGTVEFADPRVPELGLRILAPAAHASDIAAATNGIDATAADWHAHRIALGVPEGGRDFAYGDAFPHEADMDQLAGVSFRKGCFIGQEVVSRMQHRGLARKRIVAVTGAAPLSAGAAVQAGDASIGTVGSTAGTEALALVRLDRAAEAKAKGQPLTAAGVPIILRKPAWATFDLEPAAKDPA
jgi:folate-binding protein YgfZ